MKVQGHTEDMEVEEYARSVGERVAHRLATVLRDDTRGDVVFPDPDDVAASLGSLVAYLPEESPNELAALLGPFWSSAKVQDALGVPTRQALASRRKNGSVLGLKTSDGDVVYPVWQFHRRDDAIEVKPALVGMLRILKTFDPWTVAVVLRTPAPELKGLTPIDWVRAGRPAATLVELARVVAREWAAGSAGAA